jgi:hypothetical protein
MDIDEFIQESQEWVCNECGWQGTQDRLLVAPSPFNRMHVITGCPKCKEANCFVEAEDWPP